MNKRRTTNNSKIATITNKPQQQYILTSSHIADSSANSVATMSAFSTESHVLRSAKVERTAVSRRVIASMHPSELTFHAGTALPENVLWYVPSK
jgi:hypothetical protein